MRLHNLKERKQTNITRIFSRSGQLYIDGSRTGGKYKWHTIPSVATLLVQIPNTEIETPNPQVAAPEKIRLHLPSDLPPSMLNTPQVKPLADKERRLRIAQADQALAEIRRGRRIISGYSQFRKLNVAGTGTKPNTRMRSSLQ